MAEYAVTSLTFTPVAGTWVETFMRLEAFIRDEHQPASALPTRGSLLTVDAARRRILHRQPWENLARSPNREAEGVEYWRAVSLEASFHDIPALIRFAARQGEENRTFVEIQFPTKVHEGVFAFDVNEKQFDPNAKAALVRFCIRMTRRLECAGFGYRLSDEETLFGPITVNDVREYFEIGGPWLKRGLRLKIAGLEASFIAESDVGLDMDDDHPLCYRQSAFYIFDRMWPRRD